MDYLEFPTQQDAHRLLLLQLPPGTQRLVRVEPHNVVQQRQGYHAARQEAPRGRCLFFSGRRRAWVFARRAAAAPEDLLRPAQKKAPQLRRGVEEKKRSTAENITISR